MASFTDLIPQFNPYIQQLPVDAMVQVGMEKQKRYDEGVQRIQSQIDNIAGLDITKPLHKQYLQSKLDELGNNLTTVAAGDFSNFQLVNSVGGMTNQIAKDPIVQNAVMSTQHARQEQKNIQEAQKAGKSSINNEEYYYDKFNKWMNDNDLTKPFTDEFIEYKDVDAKLRDLASKLKEDELGIENPFVRNDLGQTLYFSKDPKTGKTIASTDSTKGEKRLDLDMLSVKVKGLPAERILNHFYNSLDANDIRQLRIDSWAHYKNAGPEFFRKDIENSYANKKEILSQTKVTLANKIQDPSITGPAKEKLKTQLEEVNDKIENKVLEKELAEDILELENPRNLEDFKYKIYTQNHLTNLAKDLSYKSYIEERKANPAQQADLARQRFQFDQIEAANQMFRWRVSENRLQKEFEYKVKKDEEEKISKGYRVSPGEWGTDVKPPKTEDLLKDMNGQAESFGSEQNRIAELFFPSTDPLYKNMTLNEKVTALGKKASEYRQNPNMNLNPDQKIYLEQYRQKQNDLTKTINAYSSAVKYENDFRKKLVAEKIGDRTVTASGVTFTSDDVVDFYSNIGKFEPATTDITSYFDTKNADNFYKTYKGGKLYRMWQAYDKDITDFAVMNKDDKSIMSFANSIQRTAKDIEKATAEATSKYISKTSPIYAVQRARIDVSDTKKAADLDDFLTEKSAQYDSKGSLDVSNLGDYNPTTASKIRIATGSTFQIEKRYDGGANIILRGADGTKQVVPANPSEVARFFPEVAMTSPFSEISNAVAFSPGRTTNAANQRFVPGSGSTAVNASITGYDARYLPQLRGTGLESKVRFDVEGFQENTGNPDTDLYSVIMYVPDPKTGMWKGDYITDGYVSAADAMTKFKFISPSNIAEAIQKFK